MHENIVDYVKRWAVETPYKIAYTFFRYLNEERDEVHITCRQLYEESVSFAQYLKSIGLEKGDRVIIFADQRPETLYAIYGVMMARGIFIVVPPPKDVNKKQRFLTTLESSDAKYIIYSSNENEIFRDCHRIFINPEKITKPAEAIQLEAMDIEDIVCLQYTSGSVNAPKGIMCTHKNIMASVSNTHSVFHQGDKDINVSWLPFFHAMGLMLGIFYTAYVNRRDIIMSLEVFQENPMRWLKAISKYRATYMLAPNSGYMSCTRLADEKGAENLDFSKVKYVASCSEIIQKSNWDALVSAYGKNGLREDMMYPAYGLSESTGVVTVGTGKVHYFEADWEALKQNKVAPPTTSECVTRTMAGVGKCVPDLKVVIVNVETMKECAKQEIGEIWVQGEAVAKGYWQNEGVTKETFGATLQGHEGKFLRTGDLGVFVEDELYITGRLKEMMVINGRNIYAKDIELYLKKEIPELSAAVIYGFTVPVKKKERVIIGVEYVKDVQQLKALAKAINKVMYHYFNFEAYDILFVKDKGLPRTDNGKLALMKIYHAYIGKKIDYLFSFRQDKKGQASSVFTETGQQIKEIFEEILGIECKSSEDSFLDLGGTSLEIFNLMRKLKETFGLNIRLKEMIVDSSIKGLEEKISKKA